MNKNLILNFSSWDNLLDHFCADILQRALRQLDLDLEAVYLHQRYAMFWITIFVSEIQGYYFQWGALMSLAGVLAHSR